MSQRDHPQLFASLRLWGVVAMNIVAVVGLRRIARSARLGAPSVTLWMPPCLAFFVPLAAVLAELSSRHPKQGGMYLFAAFIRLRGIDRDLPANSQAIRVPGGGTGAYAMAGCGLLATFIALGLVFIPPPGTENARNYEANLIGQAALRLAAGMALYFIARRRPI